MIDTGFEDRFMDSAEIAVIGMSGRFPGANTIEKFWQNVRDGVESVSFFSAEEMIESGADPNLVNAPNYVAASGALDNIEYFDASFFDYYPREAELIDPQQRLFLECAWEALERAGYNGENHSDSIGVYAGASMSTYLLHLLAEQDIPSPMDDFQVRIANDKDYVSTRVSYKLNLKGPSVSVNTACSTSLVAIHLACQGLLSGECDIALAGGTSVSVPQKKGYLYQEGGIASPDGRCRAFDAKAQGSIGGSGLGIVVLKLLSDAVADGDQIEAVIKGSAVNNDGSLKVGFTAPSVDGQSEVVAAAQAVADVQAREISYVEAHGTGTPLGDPIEVAALTRAFRSSTDETGFCAIGSVKPNIGHLDAAAGVVGLIKTVLALKHKMLPPSLHFDDPNPEIDFNNSPFFVNRKLTSWQTSGLPRRAGISSLGIGGTNAHVILEEAPNIETSASCQPSQVLTLSARSRPALDTLTNDLTEYLENNPEIEFADVAYTLQVGRRTFPYKRVVSCGSSKDAKTAIRASDPKHIFTAETESRECHVTFMFPGGGAQYPNMGAQLYRTQPIFRDEIESCCEILESNTGFNLRKVLYPQESQGSTAERLKQTSIALPALFATEYALSKLWMSWGISPAAMIGHSLGEYVAACLSGVLSLEDAMSLVALRGRLFEELPRGVMLSVPLGEEELLPLLNERLSLAAVNGISYSVASGPLEAIEDLEGVLSSEGVEFRRLQIDVAAHSQMLTPILGEFGDFVSRLSLQQPLVPYISNVTGTWITSEQATDPLYWVKHLRQTVRFSDGLGELLKDAGQTLVEVGPGQTLSALARQHTDKRAGHLVLPSMSGPLERKTDDVHLMNALGKLWLAGITIDWPATHAGERRHRVPLPTYPFERKRFWAGAGSNVRASAGPAVDSDLRDKEQDSAVETPVGGQTQSGGHATLDCRDQDTASIYDLESTVTDIWQDLFGIERIGPQDEFLELGGHSLLAAQLVVQIRDTLAVDLSLRDLFESSTIEELTKTIAFRLQNDLSGATTNSKTMDLDEEANLDPSISVEGVSVSQSNEQPSSIFLTGATGFLGAFLLSELLDQTEADVYCLVRCANEEEGKRKVEENLKKYSLYDKIFQERVVCVAGDLSQSLLGLTPEVFQELAEIVDAIYHCGAWVNFAYPYSALKATNVLGTEEVFRLASSVKIKPVHHVSSTSVFTSTGYSKVAEIQEDDQLAHSELLHTGYAESKWVAEKLAMIARARGIPTCIYRPGIIAGHSETGVCNTNDFIWRVLKGCVELGSAPERSTQIYMAPADYVSKAIVQLSRKRESLGKAFHLIDPEPLSWTKLFDFARSYGYLLKRASYDSWLNEAAKAAKRTEESAWQPLVNLLPKDPEERTSQPRLDLSNTIEGLIDSSVTLPPADFDLLKRYFSYFVRVGFLPAPRKAKRKESESVSQPYYERWTQSLG